MNIPGLVKLCPLRVEFSLNDSLSNSGYSNGALQFLYTKYLNFYLHRYDRTKFHFPVTLLHIVYWRSQLRFLGSDLVRRELLTREQLNEDIRTVFHIQLDFGLNSSGS